MNQLSEVFLPTKFSSPKREPPSSKTDAQSADPPASLAFRIMIVGLALVVPFAMIRAAEENQPAPAIKPEQNGIRIRVFNKENGNPLAEFRVIAGVRSGVSREVDGVVNWQPHTLRIGQDGALMWPIEKGYNEMALRIEADGFVPERSPWIKKGDASRELSFRLARDQQISGRVLTPDGQPAAGATLALAMVQRDAVIENGKLRHLGEPLPEKPSDHWRRPVFAETDADGRFKVPDLADRTAAVLIMHENGVRELPLREFTNAPHVTLQPWGRIEGRVLWQDQPGANEEISLTIHRDVYGYPGVVAQYEKTKSDAAGRFVFDRVLPGHVQLSRAFTFPEPTKTGTKSVMFPGLITHLTVNPGPASAAIVGGRGRMVKGQLKGRDSWDHVKIHFHPTAPRPARKDAWTAWHQFENSELGPIFFRKDQKPAADGTFVIANVLPGTYQLFVDGNAGYRQFSVESEPPDAPAAPLDLGEIAVKPAE